MDADEEFFKNLTADFRSWTQTKTAKSKRQKKLTADTRRLTPTKMFSPQRRRGRREILFCSSGDDDKQKHVSIADNNRIFNRRFTPTTDKQQRVLLLAAVCQLPTDLWSVVL